MKLLILFSYGAFLVTVLLTAESFDETSPITDLSVFQLFICSAVSLAIPVSLFKTKGKLKILEWLVWLVLALGFAFLALDDKLMIHERIDQAIHSWLQLKETKFSDGVDDVIVGMYGICGGTFLFWNRKYFCFSKRFIACSKCAIFLLFAMVLCDMRGIYGSGGLIRELLTFLEEWTKVFGGGFMLLGLVCALEDSRSVEREMPSNSS